MTHAVREPTDLTFPSYPDPREALHQTASWLWNAAQAERSMMALHCLGMAEDAARIALAELPETLAQQGMELVFRIRDAQDNAGKTGYSAYPCVDGLYDQALALQTELEGVSL